MTAATKTATHTPGPWTAEDWRWGTNFSSVWAVFANGTDGCMDKMPCECHGSNAEANARLIAAAPDLLEACKAAVIAFRIVELGEDTDVMCQAAIAKAEGGEA